MGQLGQAGRVYQFKAIENIQPGDNQFTCNSCRAFSASRRALFAEVSSTENLGRRAMFPVLKFCSGMGVAQYSHPQSAVTSTRHPSGGSSLTEGSTPLPAERLQQEGSPNAHDHPSLLDHILSFLDRLSLLSQLGQAGGDMAHTSHIII